MPKLPAKSIQATPLASRLKTAGAKTTRKSDEPVWKGPIVDGVTFSMLAKFMGCRERFRCTVIDGIRPVQVFNARIEYGQMWHVCEEEFARTKGTDDNWIRALLNYTKGLVQEYRDKQEQIQDLYRMCLLQFPIYKTFWKHQPDVKDRLPLFQEKVFDVPYTLPSGATIRLRGKWDSVDVIGKGKSAAVYLQENKTKSDIKPEQIKRQLSFDMQTMIYLVAMSEAAKLDSDWPACPIGGVRYNVVRRPCSGGKGSIRQHAPTKSNPQGESADDFYGRLTEIIRTASGPDWGVGPKENFFFARWKVDIGQRDIELFRNQCLDPILEQLITWYDWVASDEGRKDPFAWSTFTNDPPVHWRHPFGLYNVLDEGGSSDFDEYLLTGSEVGMTRVTSLFGELE